MQDRETIAWIRNSMRRQRVLAVLDQPLTARQLRARTGYRLDVSSYLLWELSVHGLVACLNPAARRSRLYWLTTRGLRCAGRLRLNASRWARFPDDLDWPLYGTLCFSHRGAVVRALREPMRPADIKRRIRLHDGNARISANNVRDVVDYLKQRGVVLPLVEARREHPRYGLTPDGEAFRELLLRAEVAP